MPRTRRDARIKEFAAGKRLFGFESVVRLDGEKPCPRLALVHDIHDRDDNMGGPASESELRQRRPASTNRFVPTEEGRKRDERLDKHEQCVLLFVISVLWTIHGVSDVFSLSFLEKL